LATVHFSVLLFHSPVPTAAYTLSLHDALPISLTYYDQVDDEDESETSHMLNLAGDYQLSPKTTLNASAQAGFEWETEEESTNFLDRKSTRLNSSHVKISYAVFCLKKKNKANTN